MALRLTEPGEQPLVVPRAYANMSDDSPLLMSWRKNLTPGSSIIGRFCWEFTREHDHEAARAVGRIIMSRVNDNHEYRGLGHSVVSVIPAANLAEEPSRMHLLGILKLNQRFLAEPDTVAESLVKEANKDLQALMSPYVLPLPAPEW